MTTTSHDEANFVHTYAKSYKSHPQWSLISKCDGFSMLHPETLSLLYYFSAETPGFVLEVGPYIGGSTVATASARKATGRKVISIETGGSYPTHPQLPSDDIIRDLNANLRKYNVSDDVILLKGASYDTNIVAKVNEIVGTQTIDLLFLDADGDVARDIQTFGHLLSDDCVLILDDYESEEAQLKEVAVRRWVKHALDSGLASELAIVQWGTWVGRYIRPR